jgi:CRP/FNR family transcriptional regulator, cyclic AMP receptor protein
MQKALYILAELSDRDFNWLLTEGKRKEIPNGTVLIHEGEPISALYIVLDGMLAVSVEALGGKEIARLSSGEIVGEMSFVDARPPSATVKAVEDSVVWAIPRAQLAAKLSQDTAFASHFYHAIAIFLSDRLRGTVSRLGDSKAFVSQDSTDSGNPEVLQSLELAKTKLNWLLNTLRDAH